MSKPVSAAGRRTWNTPWTTCRTWWSSASASPEATGCWSDPTRPPRSARSTPGRCAPTPQTSSPSRSSPCPSFPLSHRRPLRAPPRGPAAPSYSTAAGTRIVPGAFCRVALRRGSLVVNSSQGGGGKGLLGFGGLTAMLSRSAQGLYWIGRYLERAGHLCHLLRLQAEALVDPPRQGDLLRLEAALRQHEPAASVRQHRAGQRELYPWPTPTPWPGISPSNARIPTPYGAVSPSAARTRGKCATASARRCGSVSTSPTFASRSWISRSSGRPLPTASMPKRLPRSPPSPGWPSPPCTTTTAGASCSSGASSNEPSSLLHSSSSSSPPPAVPNGTSDADWTTLLRAYHAFEAYSGRFSGEVQPGQVLDLLVTDPLLPGSLCRSLDMAAATLTAIAPGADAHSSAGARRLAGAPVRHGPLRLARQRGPPPVSGQGGSVLP